MLQQVQQGLAGPGKGCLDVLHVAAAAAAVPCKRHEQPGQWAVCDVCEQHDDVCGQQVDMCGQQDDMKPRLVDVVIRDVQLDERLVCDFTEVLSDSSCCLLFVCHINAGFLRYLSWGAVVQAACMAAPTLWHPSVYTG